MFIIDLTYKKDLVEVEKYLPEHISFLDKQYASGHFIASGRKNPRTGGIILVNADSTETVQKIISEDPFYIQEIAAYTFTEFYPTKYLQHFKKILDEDDVLQRKHLLSLIVNIEISSYFGILDHRRLEINKN